MLLVLYQALKASQSHPNRKGHWFGMSVVLTLAFWTYTSFKFMILAVYLSLGLWCLSQPFPPRHAARRRVWSHPILSGMFTFCCISGLLLITQTSFYFTIFRGSYVLDGSWNELVKKYASHLVSSLLLPMYFQPGGDFLIEVTHAAYNRQMLSIFLAPFFVWESATLWHSKNQASVFNNLCCGYWILGTAMLALGGPQLKHHFALFPLVMFLTICGLWQTAEWIALIFRPSQLRHRRDNVSHGGYRRRNSSSLPEDSSHSLLRLDSGLPAAVAREALQQAQTASKVYILEGWGRDAVQFYYQTHPAIRYTVNHPTMPIEMETDLQAHRSIVIVTDTDAPPQFFVTHPSLFSRFQQQTHSGEQWIVTTYFSTSETYYHEEIP
jgi:hypothetical protein